MAFLIPLIPVISAVAGIAGTGIGVLGTVRQGQAAQDAAQYNAEVARQQAGIQRQQAAANAQAIHERNQRVMAAQRAAFAASGLDVGEGSPLVVQAETAAAGELDYRRALWGGDVNALAARQQANLLGWQGDQAQQASILNAVGTGVAGLSNTFTGWQQQGNIQARTDWYDQQRAAYTGGGQGGYY